MRKLLALLIVGGFTVATAAFDAHAVPLSPAKLGYRVGSVAPVAEGCGRGWHWSFRWHRCVRN
jgi:hypothetical protein